MTKCNVLAILSLLKQIENKQTQKHKIKRPPLSFVGSVVVVLKGRLVVVDQIMINKDLSPGDVNGCWLMDEMNDSRG